MYIFLSTVSDTSLSNSPPKVETVFFKKKLAQLGDEVAPKTCFNILYSTGSLFKSLFSHQRNGKRHNLWALLTLGKTWFRHLLLKRRQLVNSSGQDLVTTACSEIDLCTSLRNQTQLSLSPVLNGV